VGDAVRPDVPAAEAGDADEFSDMTVEDRRKVLADEIDRLWANMVEIQALAFMGGQDRVFAKTRRLVASRATRDQGVLRILADRLEAGHDVSWADVERFAETFSNRLHERVVQMTAREGPVTWDMVPAKIRALYASATRDGFLMHVSPKQNLFERDQLEMFRESTDRVSKHVTGTPHLILEMNDTTLEQGSRAMVAALIAIFVVLVLDFRRPLMAVLAVTPLVVGMSLTVGTMWLLGEKLNYMNMIGLPVIIGIGVDDGVHFFHRFVQEGGGGMRRAVSSVGHAMLMSSLTTMVGFGSLMAYSMRGMQSMGLVLFLGVGYCFIVTVTLLPALATVFESRIQDPGEKTGGSKRDAGGVK
jgi:predicted RND superfamily exporter protein